MALSWRGIGEIIERGQVITRRINIAEKYIQYQQKLRENNISINYSAIHRHAHARAVIWR